MSDIVEVCLPGATMARPDYFFLSFLDLVLVRIDYVGKMNAGGVIVVAESGCSYFDNRCMPVTS